MGVGAIDGAQSTVRITAIEADVYAERNNAARRVIARHAARRPDPDVFRADILSALGLDGGTDCPPSPVRLIKPDEVKGPGRRAPGATTYEACPPVHADSGDGRIKPRQHGTNAGWYQHRRLGEKSCDPCQVAYDAYRTARDDMRRGGRPARPKPACGTRGGYDKHLRDGTPPCTPCRTAKATDSRRLRAKTTTDQKG